MLEDKCSEDQSINSNRSVKKIDNKILNNLVNKVLLNIYLFHGVFFKIKKKRS